MQNDSTVFVGLDVPSPQPASAATRANKYSISAASALEQRLGEWISIPMRRQSLELALEPFAPALAFADGIEEFLEDDCVPEARL